MINIIEEEICIGCGKCARMCPVDIIRLNETHKACIAYAGDCMTCYICERACPAGAIKVDPLREAPFTGSLDISVVQRGGAV